MTALRTLFVVLTTLLFGVGPAVDVAAASRDPAVCQSVKQQIREIQAKMRNGYTAAQGIRYEERLRKLKEKRYRVCR